MCEIAPFGMKCEWEEYSDKLIMCASNRLQQAMNNLLKAIPIMGNFTPEYHCKGFEIKREVQE